MVMATSSVKQMVKTAVETVTFNANGVASTSISTDNVLLCISDTADWGAYIPYCNNYYGTWQIIGVYGTSGGDTRTVKLFYI